MADIKTGTITISGKKYECSRNELTSEILIAGMPINKFMEKLTVSERIALAFIGQKVKNKELVSPQKIMDEFYQAENN